MQSVTVPGNAALMSFRGIGLAPNSCNAFVRMPTQAGGTFGFLSERPSSSTPTTTSGVSTCNKVQQDNELNGRRAGLTQHEIGAVYLVCLEQKLVCAMHVAFGHVDHGQPKHFQTMIVKPPDTQYEQAIQYMDTNTSENTLAAVRPNPLP